MQIGLRYFNSTLKETSAIVFAVSVRPLPGGLQTRRDAKTLGQSFNNYLGHSISEMFMGFSQLFHNVTKPTNNSGLFSLPTQDANTIPDRRCLLPALLNGRRRVSLRERRQGALRCGVADTAKSDTTRNSRSGLSDSKHREYERGRCERNPCALRCDSNLAMAFKRKTHSCCSFALKI